MLNVLVLFQKGGCASTAVQPTEIFTYAGVMWNLFNDRPPEPKFRVTTASLDGQPVRIDSTLSLTPHCAFADVPEPDLVFVPAGGLESHVLCRDGYDIDAVIAQNAGVIDWLRHWKDRGTQIAAVCSGVALLAETGLLDGKRATAHWGLAEKYRERFPRVDWRHELLVTDGGDLYCGGGVNAASDLTLYLVEKFCGREVASQCAKALLIEMPRTWQTAFTHFSMRGSHDDKSIHRAQEWLQENYARKDISLETLASNLGMSNRNFARRFKAATGESPLNYLHALRVAVAKQHLEAGRPGIADIADRVGYTDILFFRTLFKRHTGLSPIEYRKRFGNSRTPVERRPEPA